MRIDKNSVSILLQEAIPTVFCTELHTVYDKLPGSVVRCSQNFCADLLAYCKMLSRPLYLIRVDYYQDFEQLFGDDIDSHPTHPPILDKFPGSAPTTYALLPTRALVGHTALRPYHLLVSDNIVLYCLILTSAHSTKS